MFSFTNFTHFLFSPYGCQRQFNVLLKSFPVSCKMCSHFKLEFVLFLFFLLFLTKLFCLLSTILHFLNLFTTLIPLPMPSIVLLLLSCFNILCYPRLMKGTTLANNMKCSGSTFPNKLLVQISVQNQTAFHQDWQINWQS